MGSKSVLFPTILVQVMKGMIRSGQLILTLYSTPSELLHHISHAQASLIFISPDLLPTLLQTLKLGQKQSYTLTTSRIILLSAVHSRPTSLKQYKCISELWGVEAVPEVFEDGQEHETAYLCYSSGTVR
jgi:long-subunit acyl-CoA synthetase (AMP-forming)